MKIQDSVAIITGASSGIGQALALQLARRNIHGLVLVDYRKSPLALTQMINEQAGDWICFDPHGDLADAEFRHSVYRESRERCGTVNICVAIAAHSRPVAMGEASEACLLDSIFWAREMVAGIGEARRRRHCSRWHASEPLAGMVILVAAGDPALSHANRAFAGIKAQMKMAAHALAAEAEGSGVVCEILFSARNPLLDIGIKGADGKCLFPSLRIQRNAAPQALSETICSVIENASAKANVLDLLPEFGNNHKSSIIRNGLA